MSNWLKLVVLSNVAYLALGWWVMRDSIDIWIATGTMNAGFAFAAALVYLGWESARYHADATAPAHYDVMAMYIVGFSLFLAAIANHWWVAFALPLIVPAAYWLRMKQLDVPMENKIGGMFAGIYGVAFLFHWPNWQVLVASAGVFVVALLIRPRHHAIWHLVSALGLGGLWIGLT